MATIALEGVRFFARHGYYEEEQVLGNTFVLDVIVNADTELAAATDELYEELEEEEIEEQQVLQEEVEEEEGQSAAGTRRKRKRRKTQK